MAWSRTRHQVLAVRLLEARQCCPGALVREAQHDSRTCACQRRGVGTRLDPPDRQRFRKVVDFGAPSIVQNREICPIPRPVDSAAAVEYCTAFLGSAEMSHTFAPRRKALEEFRMELRSRVFSPTHELTVYPENPVQRSVSFRQRLLKKAFQCAPVSAPVRYETLYTREGALLRFPATPPPCSVTACENEEDEVRARFPFPPAVCLRLL